LSEAKTVQGKTGAASPGFERPSLRSGLGDRGGDCSRGRWPRSDSVRSSLGSDLSLFLCPNLSLFLSPGNIARWPPVFTDL